MVIFNAVTGWMPTRRIIDVIHGLDSLFTDLIDFDDALNAQAAAQWSNNKVCFLRKTNFGYKLSLFFLN